MDRTRNFVNSTRRTSSKTSPSGTSDYSTCSDNPRTDVYTKRRESHILAGQLYIQNETKGSSIDYSVNQWEKNIDTEDDIFEDCEGTDDSTKHFQFPAVPNRSSVQPNERHSNANHVLNKGEANKFNDNVQELQSTNVIEDTEVIHTADCLIVKGNSKINISTGDLVINLIENINSSRVLDKPSANSTKRVLFANQENVIIDNRENNTTYKPVLKLNDITLKPMVDENQHFASQRKHINENSDRPDHNTIESHVMWEKSLESSKNFTKRRSLSFSELNSVTDSSGGDDEYSTSFQTLDDVYLLDYRFKTISNKRNSQNKMLSHKSKSCSDLLKEVKHLPHLIYQKFLKCLSKELDNMLNEDVICTCQRPLKKRSNNNVKSSKYTSHRSTTLNKNSTKENHPKELRLTPNKHSNPSKSSSESKLSPDKITNSTNISPQSSPKTPNKTSTTVLYGWKKVVSPVGEYIRGKRPCPFQKSPNKKKV